MTLVASGVQTTSQAMGLANFACGSYTGDGTQGQVVVAIGFTPRYVRLINLTDGLTYEYLEGMREALGDTDLDDTILSTWSTGDETVDDNAAIVTNSQLVTATEMALNAPGAQSADLGVTGTTSVSYFRNIQSLPRLAFNAGSSGAITNIDAKVYSWIAFG